MKLKLFTAMIVVTLAFSGLATSSPVVAESLKDKLDDNQQKQEEMQAEQQQTEEKLAEVRETQEKVSEAIERLERQIQEAESKISTKEAEIAETRANIEQLKKEIAELQQRIKERDELLKDRVRAMYQNGGSIDYIEVLLGAESFGNFLMRVMSLNTIAEQDKKILEQHIADKEAVEQKKAEVEDQLASLEESLKELEAMKEQLNADKQEKDYLLSTLEAEEEELHDHAMDIEEQNAILAAQEAAIKAEIERQKQAAEEAARRAAAEKQSSSSSSAGSSSVSPAAGSSAFIWPTNAYVTSEYGRRYHPIHNTWRLHSGIDLARNGTVPIYAAASGTVIRANYSSSYGNNVFMTHQINGQTLTTVYAHMRSLTVSAGQYVEQGQLIGYMGSTGDSTGQHLHFEIHEGPWNGSRSNSVNPRKYLP